MNSCSASENHAANLQRSDRGKLANRADVRLSRFNGRMEKRRLFVAAYDIRDPARLRRGLAVLKDFALGGQRSVFECYLTQVERRDLLKRIATVIEPDDDRFVLLRLHRRARVQVMGIAMAPADDRYFYVG